MVVETKQKQKRWFRELPIFAALAGLIAMCSPVTATGNLTYHFNGTVISIISEVALMFPTFLNLVIEMMPIIIVVSIVGFLLAFLDKILAMFKF